MEQISDEFYMQLALQMASATAGQTATNPAVGCVIVNNGRIVGVGSHLQMGGPHAEIHALNMAGSQAENGTIYVTLEPCSYHGRTPPCADQLIEAKVSRVVIAASDPNPRVSGGGIERLRAHGIEVVTGLMDQEATELNESFNKYITTGQPFVTLKTASTLDGKIATKTGDSRWVTGEAARAYVHNLRHRHMGIMVGIETVLADDPQLTTRLPLPGLHPLRIVVDSRLRIPLDSKLVRTDPQQTIILTTALASLERANELERLGVRLIYCGPGPRVDLREAMQQLGAAGVGSILLEGGGSLNGAMLENGLIDKVVLFFAPKIIGGQEAPANFTFHGYELMEQAIGLERVRVESVGEDICITGYPVYGTVGRD